MRSELAKYGLLLVVMMALANGAQAGCGCSGGGSGTWDGPAWIETAIGGSSEEAATSSKTEAVVGVEVESGAEAAPEAETGFDDGTDVDDEIATSITAQELWERLEGDSKPVIAYVSNTPIQGTYIEESIALPSKSLVQADGSLKSVDELAAVLENAGISEDDGLVIYGDCFSCGDFTFVYWIMKYLGHQNVQMLEGAAGDWDAAGLPRAAALTTRPAATYSPDPCYGLLADYEAVAGGEVQVVDARASDQFAAGNIDRAINIDYDQVIENGWIKDNSALAEVFVDLEKDRPVAVYTENGGRATIVWYALILLGYDARLYTWNDWLGHQS